MSNCYLGVGVKECPPCGGELIGLHGNRIFKLGGERDRAASSAQPFPRRSARLRPHPSKPCAVPERLLSPRNLWQIPLVHAPSSKTHIRHFGAHLRVSNKWVVIAEAYLGRGRDGVHLTPQENTFGHFGLKLGHRQLPSVWSSTV